MPINYVAMWPFTSRRIFGNRWWAIAFVVFVCWQAIQITGSDKPAPSNAEAAADAQAAQEMANAINNM